MKSLFLVAKSIFVLGFYLYASFATLFVGVRDESILYLGFFVLVLVGFAGPFITLIKELLHYRQNGLSEKSAKFVNNLLLNFIVYAIVVSALTFGEASSPPKWPTFNQILLFAVPTVTCEWLLFFSPFAKKWFESSPITYYRLRREKLEKVQLIQQGLMWLFPLIFGMLSGYIVGNNLGDSFFQTIVMTLGFVLVAFIIWVSS